ncbi:hypothetical protein ACFV8T_38395 [Streptomyces sp. NPDC059832]|uniref:hypothetical protein n=1 Tax=Streptomyces sp. NPDC059832 TaxID=3346966 RepID=UPI00364C2103
MHRLDSHALTRHATQLHETPDGHNALVSLLICTTAVQQIVPGTEHITLADLKAVNISTR